MTTEKISNNKLPSPGVSNPELSSCRKKKNEEATFLEDVKDHINDFIHASMDEHKTCFQKTIKKILRCLACQKLLQKGIRRQRKWKVLYLFEQRNLAFLDSLFTINKVNLVIKRVHDVLDNLV